ncbi:winged helix-turn-helix transcriptional regulator [Pseudomonas hefeiensis]|uniref:Winged helix-turn-helix transcriptional regulator n=1 Tax=Pseudomonas hefeiensis TaxID=2738125 RepID=A0ABY9G3C4_9PSED|nr:MULTISPECIES: winged helix-turn-helix transcriptional regulator [unclassified Pseudomonas]WLH10090.1 winged helix-turn-helix transcriptional regulator [Pseudomonas sp. FP205]WLH93170.1 winged helix-turn-helix transcriptional regulator [Pseudomonas sp. FP53]WLI37457.1 winged helix-turn-helix transcriptional regulator [Pseudomonas sp. FP821]
MTNGRNNHTASEFLGRIDEAIVDVLRRNGRITCNKLASLVHLSESPCQQRVRKLERMGVIRGYGAFIDEHKLSPGLSLVVLVTLAEGKGCNTQKAFEVFRSRYLQSVAMRAVMPSFRWTRQHSSRGFMCS